MIPLVSYILPYWDPFGDSQFIIPRFTKTVNAFYRNSDPSITKELYIVCQGNPKNAMDNVRALRDQYGFQILELTNNLGLAGGVNIGWRNARGKYLAILSQDVLMTKGCDTTILQEMEGNKDIYQMTPIADQSDYAHQRVQMPAGDYPDKVDVDRTMALKGRKLTHGTCLEVNLNYFPREILKDVGYMDERWKGDYENADYGIRINMANKENVIHNGAFVWHLIHTTSTYIGRLQAYSGYIDGADVSGGACEDLMWKKWSPTIRDESKWYQAGRMGDVTRAQLRRKYPNNIYHPYVQDRGY